MDTLNLIWIESIRFCSVMGHCVNKVHKNIFVGIFLAEGCIYLTYCTLLRVFIHLLYYNIFL